MKNVTLSFFRGDFCFYERSSDVEEGGETVFPNATAKGSAPSAKSGISVKPKMGDALLFWSMKPDGSLDPKSLHGEFITQSCCRDMFFNLPLIKCHVIVFNCKSLL